MFYSHELLCLKKGKFSTVWLAATRGEKNLSRRDVNGVNIYDTCKEILGCIRHKSKLQLSLYLSAQLSYGVCVVYRRKCVYLLNDLQELYTKSLVSFRPNEIDLPAEKIGDRRAIDQQIDLDFNLGFLPGQVEEFGNMGPGIDVPSIENIHSVILNVSQISPDKSKMRNEDISILEEVSVRKPNNFSMGAFGDELEPLNPDCLLLFTDAPFSDIQPTAHQEVAASMEIQPSCTLAVIPEMEEPGVPLIESNILSTDKQDSKIPTKRSQPDDEKEMRQSRSRKKAKLDSNSSPQEKNLELEAFETTKEADINSLPQESTSKQDVQLELPANNDNIPVPVMEEIPSEQIPDENCLQPDIHNHQPPPPVEPINEQVPIEITFEGIKNIKHNRPSAGPATNVGTRVKSKLQVDSKITFDRAQLRANLESSASTLQPRGGSQIAPGIKPGLREVATSSVARLIALPGRWEVAICPNLRELWSINREICLESDDIIDAPMDEKIEVLRATAESPQRKQNVELEPIVGTTNQQIPDLPSPGPIKIPQEESITATVQEPIYVHDAVPESTHLDPSTIPTDIHVVEPQMVEPVTTQTIVTENPLPEERQILSDCQPDMQQVQQQIEEPMEGVQEQSLQVQSPPMPNQFIVPDSQAAPMPPQPGIFNSEKSVWRAISEQMRNESNSQICFHDVCPPGSNKKDACLVFRTLLQMAKLKKVKLFQSSPFKPIFVSITNEK